VSNGEAVVSGSTFSGNNGYNGGALYIDTNGKVTLKDVIFDGNVARNIAGAFRNQGIVVLAGQITLKQNGSSITDNIYNGKTMIVDAVSCLENNAVTRVVDASAAGWLNQKGTLSVTDGYKLFYEGTQDDMYVTAATTDLTKLSAIVSEKGDVFNVLQIILELLLPADVVASAHLRKPRQTLTDAVAAALLGAHKDHVAHQQRARADDAHITLQNIDKLGQLVERGGAQELAVLRKTLLIGQRIAVFVRFAGHGAELDQAKNLLVLTGTLLGEEGIALHLHRAKHRQNEQHRREHHKRAK
jgi:hypothetical protein